MKKTLQTVVAVLLAAGLYLIFQYSKTLTPEQVMQQLFDMNIPIRYAFISDEKSAKLAVLDMNLKQQTGLLNLQMPAHYMAINKKNGLLTYSDGSPRIVLHTLSQHQEKTLDLSHQVRGMYFSADGHHLIVRGENRISIVTWAQHQINTVTGYQHIQTAVYTPFANQLWIIDSTPALYRYDIATGQQMTYRLPPEQRHFSAAAVSPDNHLLVFGATDNYQHSSALIRDNDKQQIVKTLALSAPLVQPYIDNSGNHLIMIDRQGKGMILNAQTLETEHTLQTVNPTEAYATGWLGTKLLITGQALQLYNLNNFRLEDTQIPGSNSRSLFITGDSKYALISYQGQLRIALYELQHNTLQYIPITGITSPDKIIMGASNTLCH